MCAILDSVRYYLKLRANDGVRCPALLCLFASTAMSIGLPLFINRQTRKCVHHGDKLCVLSWIQCTIILSCVRFYVRLCVLLC